MNRFAKFFILCLILSFSTMAMAQVGDLPRTTPEQQGMSSAGVERFIDSLFAVPETHFHHVMVLRHGAVVAEAHPAPFSPEYAHTEYSASKTFVALGVGAAIDENRLRLTDRVASFFPEKMPDTIAPWLAQMTVRDLLIMGSGLEINYSSLRANNDDWISAFLATTPKHEPGTHFYYDSMCSYMLSAIVQRVTGKTLLQYLQEKYFNAMHITAADWEQCPQGYNTGGWGLRVQAESLAKLGILLLNRGNWNGQQLVSAEWIDQATSKQIECAATNTPPTDGNQGYCYQIWRSKYPGSFRADGALAQYVVCVPQFDLVVVINSLSYHGHDLLGCIWDHLIPAIVSEEPLPAQNKAAARLSKKCLAFTQPLIKGKATSKLLPQMANNGIVTIAPEGCEPLTITLTDDKHLTLDWHYGNHNISHARLAFGKWEVEPIHTLPLYTITARSRFSGIEPDFVCAGNYAWTSPSVLTMTVYYPNWISARTVTIDFKARTVAVNDNFSPRKTEVIKF